MAKCDIQMELIEMQSDSVLMNKFIDIEIPQIYSYLPINYPEMCLFAARILAMFGSTYLCEQLFLLMKANKTSQRSRLTTEHLSSILKITSAQNQNTEIENLFQRKDFKSLAKVSNQLREGGRLFIFFL